jgi:clan AA aspartic protease (TIGR02281 family)
MRNFLFFILFFGLSLSVTSQTSIVLEKRNGVYYIPCRVNGLNMKFIFDTGASNVTISLTEALFMLKNGYLLEKDLIGTTYYEIANGDIQKGTKILIRKIEIGGRKLFNVEASIIHNSNAPLLLGQSALEKLGKIYFDYSKNMLVILDSDVNSFYYGCISGDCFNGFGTKTNKAGDKYVGNFLEGKYNGKGIMTFANGDIYRGDFKDDFKNGQGIYIFKNGDKYEGSFIDDKLNGHGTYIHKSGDVYVGDFVNGIQNGNGMYTYKDGESYRGEFQNNKYNGTGTLTFVDGSEYKGEFKDSKFHGNGKEILINGSMYVGEFQDDKFNGIGTLTFEEGGSIKVNLKTANIMVTGKKF